MRRDVFRPRLFFVPLTPVCRPQLREFRESVESALSLKPVFSWEESICTHFCSLLSLLELAERYILSLALSWHRSEARKEKETRRYRKGMHHDMRQKRSKIPEKKVDSSAAVLLQLCCSYTTLFGTAFSLQVVSSWERHMKFTVVVTCFSWNEMRWSFSNTAYDHDINRINSFPLLVSF